MATTPKYPTHQRDGIAHQGEGAYLLIKDTKADTTWALGTPRRQVPPGVYMIASTRPELEHPHGGKAHRYYYVELVDESGQCYSVKYSSSNRVNVVPADAAPIPTPATEHVVREAPRTFVTADHQDGYHCRECQQQLPVTKFPTTAAGPSVRSTRCRPCRDSQKAAA